MNHDDLPDYWRTLPRSGWADDAACIGMPTEHWTGSDTGDPSMAKLICSHCRVSDDCLAFTLHAEPNDINHRYGIFGGMTPDERHRFFGLLLESAA